MRKTEDELSSFEWDETKRTLNLEKHGLDFEDAILALQKPRLEFSSNRDGEIRTLAICPDTNKLIAVVYTMRGKNCRIISVRAARKNEQELYDDSYRR